MKFAALAAAKKKALIIYLMAGDPDLAMTEKLVLALEQAGADLIELGVPFSDPIADGPVIQRAAERALKSETTLASILSLVRRVRERTDIPLILMGYENPIFKYGEARFVEDAVKAGVDGLIVPDLPMEEAAPLLAQCDRQGLDLIFLAAPTSPPARLKKLADMTRGFLYYVSMTGITGTALDDYADVRKQVQAIKRLTDKPVAVGFGISTPDRAKRVAEFADGVVVGSAVVKMISDTGGQSAEKVAAFVRALKDAVGRE